MVFIVNLLDVNWKAGAEFFLKISHSGALSCSLSSATYAPIAQFSRSLRNLADFTRRVASGGG